MKNFSVNWIIHGKLAIGQAPQTNLDLEKLRDLKIKSIFSICEEKEVKLPEEMESNFVCKKLFIPDHKYNFLPKIEEIKECVIILDNLLQRGSVYIHCVAGKERSPLICVAWLVKKKNIELTVALDFVSQQHRRANPLSEHLKLLNEEQFRNFSL